MTDSPIEHWFGHDVPAGGAVNAGLQVTESYSGRNISIPIRVVRGAISGPTVFVTGALHGDELNGTGAIRSLLADPDFELKCGTAVMIPVLNILGFERHSRYLPDRRDLNRCFPGNESGSMAMRMARVFFIRSSLDVTSVSICTPPQCDAPTTPTLEPTLETQTACGSPKHLGQA